MKPAIEVEAQTEALTVVPPTIAELAWAAGFIDGEGSFCISNEKDNRKPSGQSYHRAAIQVSNTCRPSLDKLQKILFSYGKIITLKRKKAHHKIQYRLAIRNKPHIAKTIVWLLPYLITKHKVAEACLVFCIRRYDANTRGRGRYAPFTQPDFDLIQLTRDLNKRCKP